MKLLRTLAALAGILAAGGELRAQVQVIGGPYGGIGISFSSRRISGVLIGPGPYGRPGYLVGPGYYPGFGPPFGVTTYSTTVELYGPGSMGRSRMTPPPVPQEEKPAQTASLRDEDFPDKIIIRPGRPVVHEVERPRPLPGVPAGKFRPVLPEDRARAREPGPEPGKAPEAPKPPAPKPADKPPLDAYGRQIELAKEAFTGGEYGLAVMRFQAATKLSPRKPLGWFLLAQSQFALGKYAEAVASLHAGLKLQPEWPATKFNPREMYGNLADWSDHVRILDDALRRNPNDPALLFLSAYQKWFDGQKVEARNLFRRAAKRVANPRFIDLFLNARGDARLAMR